MLPDLPLSISILFILTTAIAVWLFYRATNYNRSVLAVLAAWAALQMVVAFTGFYRRTNTIPPRLALLIGPPLLFIIGLFVTKRGRQFIDSLRLDQLTVLHFIRINVEIILFMLFISKAIPEVMTFEGRNFDILAGLTAPLVYYLAFVRRQLSQRALLFWNLLCLGLLTNIVVTALLSAPTPFQRLAFDQPNIAIQYFPFVWLPSVVVPIVLFSHLTAIRRLSTAQ
ncbi:hypothetical protein HH216_07735 [Spirosoma rhododendri]|uniref:Uncharacterized protein n=2 Tax=Spirosoma rhododendri TaxID=2728024 RepID=A0A7L5DIW4_9BACT|nr:hypothetical protein HH216_07735 [Spirosoma rhododendri]